MAFEATAAGSEAAASDDDDDGSERTIANGLRWINFRSAMAGTADAQDAANKGWLLSLTRLFIVGNRSDSERVFQLIFRTAVL